MHLGPGGPESVYHVAGLMFAAALYLLAVWFGKRAAVGIAGVFALGLVMRLLLLAAPPAPNPQDDYYRYLWDGSVVAQGLNPYRYSPQEAGAAHETGADPRLAELAASGKMILPRINHPHLTTIYPPVAQGGFALAYLLKPFSVIGLRVVFLGFDLATFVLLLALLRRLHMNPGLVLVYWWNPVALNWIYGEVHMDVMLFPFVLLAVLAALSWRPVLTATSLAVAAGVKLWPVVLLPVLAWRWRRHWPRALGIAAASAALSLTVISPLLLTRANAPAGAWAYAEGWQNNAGLFTLLQGGLSLLATDLDARFWARGITLALLGIWILLVIRGQSSTPQALIRGSLLVVAAVFLLSPTQFPWYYTWLLPLLVFWPIPALLAYTFLLPLYNLTAAYPWVVWLEHVPIWLFLGWELGRKWRQAPTSSRTQPRRRIASDLMVARVAVVIPALNEERAIGQVLNAIPKWVKQAIVADNGSTDRTAALAQAAGAQVVVQPRRGYGAACLAGIAALEQPDIVVFVDADFSDDPSEMEKLLSPILEGKADFVIGSRTLGACEPGALTVQQRFGNALACNLIRWLWGHSFSDLGPFRAIRSDALSALEMDDRDYGWTIQMQLRALRVGRCIQEVPVGYRRRIGTSKVSGTLRGVFGAGTKILSLIVREKFWQPQKSGTMRERVVVFARYPVPGKTKTRLIPRLGEGGAAALQDAMTRHTLVQVAGIVRTRGVETEVCFTGGDSSEMAKTFGREWTYAPQGDGDLGQRMHHAIRRAFARGSQRVLVIGTDCPGITAASLQIAFDALRDHDLVVGPAADGGFYLIGLRQPFAGLFAGIAWGTNAVLSQLLASASRLRLSVSYLATLHDVDRPEDLPVWEAQVRKLRDHGESALSC